MCIRDRPDSAEAIHLMVEAKKIAFRDRMKYFGDPEFVENPTEILLSEEYASQVAGCIHMDSCANEDDVLSLIHIY